MSHFDLNDQAVPLFLLCKDSFNFFTIQFQHPPIHSSFQRLRY